MTDPTHPVWTADGPVDAPVAGMGGEALVVPAVAVIVSRDDSFESILLQRRDRPEEGPVRGLLEMPSGRWRAGESAAEVVAREIVEETGMTVVSVAEAIPRGIHAERPHLQVEPVTVTVGVGGAYPVLHLCFECVARGEPRPSPGETAEPQWVSRTQLESMLARPESFTDAAVAVLRSWLDVRR